MSVSFHRTPHGLSNQATFENVDAIVYAEGGSAFYNLPDLESGGGDPSTLDAAFWSVVLRSAAPDKVVRVRSVGSKTTLKSLANLLVAASVRRVLVAMDRDFDHLRLRLIEHTNILYTYGYSWENDVFDESVLSAVLGDFAPQSLDLMRARAHLKQASHELARGFSMVVRIDHSLARAGQDLTNREALENSVRRSSNGPPVLLRGVVASELSRVRNTHGDCRPCDRNCACVQADLHGHTLSKWWLAHLQHLLQIDFAVKVSNDVLVRLAISAFAKSETPGRDYYHSAALRVVWS